MKPKKQAPLPDSDEMEVDAPPKAPAPKPVATAKAKDAPPAAKVVKAAAPAQPKANATKRASVASESESDAPGPSKEQPVAKKVKVS